MKSRDDQGIQDHRGLLAGICGRLEADRAGHFLDHCDLLSETVVVAGDMSLIVGTKVIVSPD